MKEGTREIYACPHFQKLADDEKSGVVSKEQAEEMEKRLGLHGIEGPDGVAIVMCTKCYAKGRIVMEGRNSRKHRLMWPIQLDEFKAKEGK